MKRMVRKWNNNKATGIVLLVILSLSLQFVVTRFAEQNWRLDQQANEVRLQLFSLQSDLLEATKLVSREIQYWAGQPDITSFLVEKTKRPALFQSEQFAKTDWEFVLLLDAQGVPVIARGEVALSDSIAAFGREVMKRQARPGLANGPIMDFRHLNGNHMILAGHFVIENGVFLGYIIMGSGLPELYPSAQLLNLGSTEGTAFFSAGESGLFRQEGQQWFAYLRLPRMVINHSQFLRMPMTVKATQPGFSISFAQKLGSLFLIMVSIFTVGIMVKSFWSGFIGWQNRHKKRIIDAASIGLPILADSIVTETAQQLSSAENVVASNQDPEDKGRPEDRIQMLEKALRESESRFQTLAGVLSGPVFLHRKDVLYMNPAAENLVGRSVEKMAGDPLLQLIHKDDWITVEGSIKQLLSGQKRSDRLKIRAKKKNGGQAWLELNSCAVMHKGHRTVISTGLDVSKLRAMEVGLRAERDRVKVIMDSVGDGIVITDVRGRVQFINPVAEKLTGWQSNEARNQSISEVVRLFKSESEVTVNNPVSASLRSGRRVVLAEQLIIRQGEKGKHSSVEVSASPIETQNGAIAGAILVITDMSEVTGLSERISYQSSHDTLTDLPNRKHFELLIHESIERASKELTRHALCYMDLDEFKVINDTCGHVVGDALLRQLAIELKSHVRPGDHLGRLGGDEFALLLTDCSLDAALELSEHMRNVISDFRFDWQDQTFEIASSISVVPITPDTESVNEVLSDADAACYIAKDNGRNRVQLYRPGDAEVMRKRDQMQWMQRIQRAIDERRFRLYAQKIMSLDGEEHLGAPNNEILLRMIDENEVLIAPSHFIPAAERFHMMPMIDRWVVKNVCRALVNQPETSENVYSINLSGQTLCDQDFLDYVVNLLDETGVEPNRLCFEVTETAVIRNIEHAKRFIGVLRGMGCKFALDDFGSGLSSFAYLKNLEMDFLKIDGQFVRSMFTGRIDKALLEIMNDLGKVVGIKTIAEFVEDGSQLNALRSMGVDFAQGYFIGEPTPIHIAA